MDGGLGASLLDSYPHTIAVLDGRGRIVWANEAWREFGESNGLAPGSEPTGQNYLDAIETTADPYAQRALDGLTAVLAGDRVAVSEVYPCHGTDSLRWFRMRAFSVAFSDERYCLVAHEDVTTEQIGALLTEGRQELADLLNEMLLHEVGNALTSADGALAQFDGLTADESAMRRLTRAHERIEQSIEAARRLFQLIQHRPSFERHPVEDVATTAWDALGRDAESLVVADDFPLICSPVLASALLKVLFDCPIADSDRCQVTIRAGRREFYVDDARSDPVPRNTSNVFELSPVLDDGRYTFGLSLAKPLAHLHGWNISLDSSPTGGWRFVVRTEQPHRNDAS
ncbi:PAS domain-containing protein (plasmid) [Haloarcula salina]|uniref:PAS domain-containing protein n=1 Tax=Haloarcula salina TaxID=1429914 RepID=UPI003C6EF603